jgi:glycolate oxidase FAD binding subunit
VLGRVAGAAAQERVRKACELLEREGLDSAAVDNDEEAWSELREGQRSPRGTVVRISALPSELDRIMRAADGAGASVVARAGLGLAWVTLPDGEPAAVAETVGRLRSELGPAPCVVLDAPDAVRERVDVWGPVEGAALMRRVKQRFDPAGVCNPGVMAGGI